MLFLTFIHDQHREYFFVWSNNGEPPHIDFDLVGDSFVHDESIWFVCF